jgi:hypothetical protein
VVGDDLKVADGGGLDFLSFDGSHGLTRGPPARGIGSQGSSLSPQLLPEAANLVPVMFASCSRVCFKAGQNLGAMAAYL